MLGFRRWQVLLCSLLVVLALGVISSCSTKPRHNIVLIVIDTLRADHLPFYGYAANTAPFLSVLAERGVVFEHAHSTSSWTAPATASLITSLHPVQHGVLSGFLAVQVMKKVEPAVKLLRVPDGVTSLAETLREAGYRTYAASDNINISREQGFDQGFDEFWHMNDRGADVVNARIMEWASRIEESEPYFVYVHYMDPHRPYLRRSPWYTAQDNERDNSVAAYDSEIRYTDLHIQRLFERFRWDQNTLVIVTSDHGEEFLDHGGWDHGATLYGEVLDIPLLVYAPQDEVTARRVAERVSILDVVPTVRAFVGLSPSPDDQGIDLWPTIQDGTPPPEDRWHYADLRSPPWFGSQILKSVIHGNAKLIHTAPETVEFYDLAIDPKERTNLAAREVQRVRLMLAQQHSFESDLRRYAPMTVVTELSEEKIEKLKALGYIR